MVSRALPEAGSSLSGGRAYRERISLPPLRSSRCRAQRGAALVYALAAVMIISILVLGIGRFVVYHYAVALKSQGYARAIYVAEAAANWQLSRMSRCNLPGNSTEIAGRMTMEQFRTSDPYFSSGAYALPTSDLNGLQIPGSATVYVTAIDGFSQWAPPSDFNMYVLGTDTASGITRGFSLRGSGTGLSDRFVLFGENGLTFASGSSASEVCTLQSGFIGSNGTISFTGTAPQSTPPGAGGQFGGCRLGPAATMTSGSWVNGWDIPRFPTPFFWAPIDDIVRFIWNGATPDGLATSNDNAEISYKIADGSYVTFSTPPSQLTDAEFSQSNFVNAGGQQQRTIRLHAPGGANHNLFYFTNIQMGPNDVLVLDFRQQTPPGSFHILINNSSISQTSVKVTNVAYYESTDPNFIIETPKPSFFWYNNTNKPLEFEPNLDPDTTGDIDTYPNTHDSENYRYRLIPGIHGIAYGLNALSAAANTAGDIIVNGNSFTVKVTCAVANHVRINGKVTALQENVEETLDPYRYILFYRITRAYSERQFDDFSSLRRSVVGYGSFYH